MALKKKPVTGMKDILPKEMEIRNYVMNMIRETYGKFGFSAIETPCVEHIENLSSKQGGENEKLIFKILKRGEKLKLDTAECEADLVDSGLRYDLTVPLSRYYSNNAGQLPTPFKAWAMSGERTVRREAVSASLCSVILIFLVSLLILQKLNLSWQQRHCLANWISIISRSVSMTEKS